MGKYSDKEIATTVGTNQSNVFRIRRKQIPSLPEDVRAMEFPNTKRTGTLSPGQVHHVCKLIVQGKLSPKQIGDKFDVSAATIGMIKSGNNWKHISKLYFNKRKHKHV